MIAGRNKQVELMRNLLNKKKSDFIAVTGRRRIGKTYLIDEVYKDNLCLRITGIQDATMEEQIINFVNKITEYARISITQTPQNWQQVFFLLKEYLKTLSKKKKHVIFIDELSWIATKRSGFIQLLAHLWNDYLSKEKHFILVICGSATSWISQKIVNDKGGLHNRLTLRIHLEPFTLSETKQFLQSKNIRLTSNSIAEIYMILGGVPFYLEQIKKGESVGQAISRICFSKNGILKNEYANLYRSLFENAENHEAIVAVLAKSHQGLTRNEIISNAKIDAGGPYTRAMGDLIESGFVREITPYGKKKRGSVYRLMDEYSIFYHKFIKPNKNKDVKIWEAISSSQTYKIWTGFAFENLCIRHIEQIKNALGISGIYTEYDSYQQQSENDKSGYQIDLIIDRNDNVINLCECKFYQSEFTIDKTYATKIRQRKQAFINDTQTKKNIFNTWITNYSLIKNEYYYDVVDKELTLENLI